MRITPPADSVYETADPEIRTVLDEMVAGLRAAPDWQARASLMLEMVDALDLAINTDAGDEDDAWEGEDDLLDQDGLDEVGNTDADFAEVVTFYAGAVLERLGEKEITAPEQAAFYMLSCHPEHLDAVQAWLAQPANEAGFAEFVDANPDYGTILETIEEAYADLADEED